MNIMDTSLGPDNEVHAVERLIGGFFLQLAYFGTDQSQVQRYLSGQNVKQAQRKALDERAAEDPHAVLHPADGGAGVRVLPVQPSTGSLE
jgi:hypothetical protein